MLVFSVSLIFDKIKRLFYLSYIPQQVLLKKQQEVMDDLLMNLMQAQDVKIFEDKIK